MHQILALLALLSGLALGQDWYLGAYATGLSGSSQQTLNIAAVAGAKDLLEGWGLRGSVGLQVASTYFKGTVGVAALGHIWEDVYGGGGLGAEFKVLPALPSALTLSFNATLGYEYWVTPYWSLIAELSPKYVVGGGFALDFLLGLNLYFQSRDNP